MTPEKKLKIAELIATVSLSIAVLSAGAAYYFYDRWKSEEDKFMSSELQNSVYSNRSDSYSLHLQKKLQATDSLIHLLALPSSRTIPISSGESGIVVINDLLKKFFIKVETEDSKKLYYQVIIKNKNAIDSIAEYVPKGEFVEINYPGMISEVSVRWK